MGSVSILLRKPPYGTVDAAEAIRHALGGVSEDMSVKLILLNGGVFAAKKGQDVSSTQYSSVEEGIRDCIAMGVEVFVDKGSMKEHQLEPEQLIDGVTVANSYEIAEIIKSTDTVMIF